MENKTSNFLNILLVSVTSNDKCKSGNGFSTKTMGKLFVPFERELETSILFKCVHRVNITHEKGMVSERFLRQHLVQKLAQPVYYVHKISNVTELNWDISLLYAFDVGKLLTEIDR